MIFCAAVGLTQIGRLLPTPQTLAFNPPGCELPCVLNIVPGITTKTQAEKILAANTLFHLGGDSDYEHQLVGNSPDQPYIAVGYVYPDEVLYQVSVFREGKSLTTLEQLFLAGHQVHRIIRSSYAMGTQDSGLFLISFDKNDQITAVVSASKILDSSSAVVDIVVIGGSYQTEALQGIRSRWHGDDEIRWLGFTSVQRYLAEPAIP